MRFTLSLSDYIDQYITNLSRDNYHCPVCYEESMEHNRTKDMEHLVECYRVQLLELRFQEYFNKHGDYPRMTAAMILEVVDSVQREMEQYCLMNQI